MTKPKPKMLRFHAGPHGVAVPGTVHVLAPGTLVEFEDDAPEWEYYDLLVEAGQLVEFEDDAEGSTEIPAGHKAPHVHVNVEGADKED